MNRARLVPFTSRFTHGALQFDGRGGRSMATLLFVSAAAAGCSSEGGGADSGGDPAADGGAAADVGSELDARAQDPDAGDVDGGLPVGAAPPRRGDMAYALDPASDRVFMFFGDRAEPMMCGFVASDFIDDGWVFDLRTGRWAGVEVRSGTAPMRRARTQGVWDSVQGRFILFGGRFRAGTTGSYTFMNDAWAFDPISSAWTEISPQGARQAPSGRMNATMVSDPDENRVLVHGGGTTDFNTFTADSQTWALDLGANTWTRIATELPQPTTRIFHVAAIDKVRRRMYVFGGCGEDCFTATQFYRDLWYLDLATNTWAEVPAQPSAPPPLGRIKATMEYDEAGDRLILFAGHDDGQLGNDNDVWTFDLATSQWSRAIEGDRFNRLFPGEPFCDFPADFASIDPESPERRESHLFVVSGDRALMYGGRTDCGLTNDTWLLDVINMRWTPINNSFNGMTCFRSGRTDCNDPNAKKCG